MKYIILSLFFVSCFVGCATQTQTPQVTQELIITKDRRPTEQHDKVPLEFLPIKSFPDTPLMERRYIVKNTKTGQLLEGNVQEVYDLVVKQREVLYYAILWYNWSVTQLIRLHEQDDLNIDLQKIPEKADIRWFVPIEIRK